MDRHLGLWSPESGPVPLLGVKVEGDILGRGARVRVFQRFKNTEAKPIEAVYRFPLPETAAVCGFKVRVGDRTIDGAVEERDKAFEQYDEALIKGHGAYLFDQERSNIFTLSVGNLNPRMEAIVEIEYVTLLDSADSKVRFALPTSISPRYVPDDMPDEEGIPTGDSIHPEYAVDVPYGLSLSIKVHDAPRIKTLESPSHPIRCDLNNDPAVVEFSAESVKMDRDFILYVGYEDSNTVSRVYRYRTREETYLQVDLNLETEAKPPRGRHGTKKADGKKKRELIFVLDCSGSMMGDSITQAKKALEICLKGLEPGTAFNIYRFGSTFESLFEKATVYDRESLALALKYLATTDANLGGTEILSPLKDIYGTGPPKRSDGRDIILVTDGEIANEDAVIRLARSNRSTTRVFTLGIGAGPNEYLIRGLAKASKGVPGFIFPGERIEPKVLSMFRDVLGTCVEDLAVTWNHKDVEQAPEVPVVYLGRPATIFYRLGKVKGKDEGLTLTGRVNGRKTSWEIGVVDAPGDHLPIHLLWARGRIRDLEGVVPLRGSRQGGRKLTQAKAAVVEISKRYGLLSRFTSYLGIEKRKGKARTRDEVVLRKVPVLVTMGWHGLGGLPGYHRWPTAFSLPRSLFAYIEGCDGGDHLFEDMAGAIEFVQPCKTMPGRRVTGRKLSGAPRGRTRNVNLLKILSLQQAEGGFELTGDVAKMLGVKIRDLKKLAKQIEVDAEVDRWRLLCTAVVIKTLATHFAQVRSSWEGPAGKSIRWLNKAVTEGNPRFGKEPLMDFVAGFVGKKVKLKM